MTVKKELKLKAKIEDIDLVKGKVKKIAKYVGKEKTTDFFYLCDKIKDQYEFRIRKLRGNKIISFKLSLAEDPVQENEEYTFKVDDADDFVRFIEVLGFRPLSMLRKNCEVYQKKDIAIRLSEVESLGDYIELTVECKEDFSEEKKEEMVELLKQVWGSGGNIDNRYYGAIKEESDVKNSGFVEEVGVK
ncbi:MAG: class IV adenylate cyclase [Nanoarchaeota archaeon]